MSRQIVISARGEGLRAAVLENGRLVEYRLGQEESMAGNIYLGVVADVVPGMSAAFVDLGVGRNALLAQQDVILGDKRRSSRSASIASLLAPGQPVLVQARKAPIGEKGARVTMRISLPARHCVLLPLDAGRIGVSRKIRDPEERNRLRAVAAATLGRRLGAIVRTEAEGHSEQVLRDELKGLLSVWADIKRRSRRKKPALLWRQPDLLERIVRDVLTSDTELVAIDDRAGYETLLAVVKESAPHLADRVSLYEERTPLFKKYRVEEELEKALRPNVKLASGGSVTIEETEACTTVDVDTGKFVGSRDIEDTALRTNLEAAEEIALQLRLRDIGGIIIIDFIDMAKAAHRQQLLRHLEEALARDRARTRVVHISPLGLVEMTRKRTGRSLVQVLFSKCPTC